MFPCYAKGSYTHLRLTSYLNTSLPAIHRYFVNFTVDTVVGVFICFGLLKLLECAARKYQWTSVMRTGDYGDPPKVRREEKGSEGKRERREGGGEMRGKGRRNPCCG